MKAVILISMLLVGCATNTTHHYYPTDKQIQQYLDKRYGYAQCLKITASGDEHTDWLAIDECRHRVRQQRIEQYGF